MVTAAQRSPLTLSTVRLFFSCVSASSLSPSPLSLNTTPLTPLLSLSPAHECVLLLSFNLSCRMTRNSSHAPCNAVFGASSPHPFPASLLALHPFPPSLLAPRPLPSLTSPSTPTLPLFCPLLDRPPLRTLGAAAAGRNVSIRLHPYGKGVSVCGRGVGSRSTEPTYVRTHAHARPPLPCPSLSHSLSLI